MSQNQRINGSTINIISNEICTSSAKNICGNATTNQSRVFYVTNGNLKPIHWPNIKSGVFRSTKMTGLGQEYSQQMNSDKIITAGQKNISLSELNTQTLNQGSVEEISAEFKDCSGTGKLTIFNSR